MSSQSRIHLYKEAMAIEHEREALKGKMDELQERLAAIQKSLFSTVTFSSPTARPKSSGRAESVSSKSFNKPRAARGELKHRILEALAAAGTEGIQVRDLAKSIGSKPAALHSWFQFARKNIKAIRKAGKGRYRLVGVLPELKTDSVTSASQLEASEKPTKKGKRNGGMRRGQLSLAIQGALEAAGKDGIRVNDLAKTLNVNPRNLFVWFATTGKQFKGIKKVSPGHYRLQD